MALTGKAPGPSLSICLESSFSKPENREIQHFSCLEARPWQQRGFAGMQGCAAESPCPLSSLPKGFFAPSSCPCEEDASCTPAASRAAVEANTSLWWPHTSRQLPQQRFLGTTALRMSRTSRAGGSPLLGHPKSHQPQPHASWARRRRSCTWPLLLLAAVERS